MEYFANDNYIEDINEENPLGMKGQLQANLCQKHLFLNPYEDRLFMELQVAYFLWLY